MRKYLVILLPILSFVLPLGLYVKTLAPTFIPIDAAEFTLCIHFWGICHSPGFPLYVMLGRFFEAVFPFGMQIYKTNLLSAIYGAGTILFLYLALGALGVRRGFAILLVLFFSVTNVFWEFSLSADVFTFSTLLVAVSFYLLFKNRRNLAFFALGLSASHFYISIVLTPLFCWYFDVIPLKFGDDAKKLKPFILAVVIFCVGFFPQIVMYIRMLAHPEISWGHVNNFGDYINYLRRKEFGSIFLIANPVLTFSLVKMFKQLLFFWKQLFFDFMVILPAVCLIAPGHLRFLANRKVLLLVFSIIILSGMQLFLLSTIDPSGADNPFQINKFYLTSFVIFVLIAGLALQFLNEKLFGADQTYLHILMVVLTAIVFLSNLKTHDYSKNYFTENFITDALSKLPNNSIVITVDHPFYFGSLYEQKINHKFGDTTILYFPNDKNRDSENYHPEVFRRVADKNFIGKVSTGKKLGAAEEYTLSVIAKNLDRPTYIVQGSFEDNFFSYLKPYILPQGLFWKVIPDKNTRVDPKEVTSQFLEFKNSGFKKDDFSLRQQGFEAQAYAISYFNSGHILAVNGYFPEALVMFEKSMGIDSAITSVAQERDLVLGIEKLSGNFNQLVARGDIESLNTLGGSYIKLGAFQKAIETYSAVLTFDSQDAPTFNNLASAYAYSGDRDSAIKYYKQSLAINPNLDLAKQGLAKLENQF